MNVKVWNKGPLDWKEEYKGDIISIPRGEYITMGRSRAIKLLGQFSHFHKEGNDISMNQKILVIEEDPEERATMMDQPLKFTASDVKMFRSLQGQKNYEKTLTVGGSPSGKQRRANG